VREPLESTWKRIRGELRRDASDFKFQIWLEPLELAAQDGTRLFVRAPEHIRSWVSERHLPLLTEAAQRALGSAIEVEVVGEEWVWAPAEPDPEPVGRAADGRRLNPKYTFEQFVIGDGNRLAHAAALAAAELPGQAYNPLFIYGRPGLGKTHLLQAIGNYVERFGGGMTVHYATVEEFTSEFVDAVKSHSTSAFKQRFRGPDVVLIDDVQFLAEKTRTKEEFFHTFNALQESGRQLVVSSDREPGDLDGLEQRLAERFASGLVVGLEPPDLDVRLAILRKRARLDGVTGFDDEVLAEVARWVTDSVRALEGALIRVVAYASLRGESATPQLVRDVLGRLGPEQAAVRCSLDEIQERTAAQFGITREDLVSQTRRSKVAQARQVAMYLTRELTDESLAAIGRGFGGRNHATVFHAHRKITEAVRAGGSERRLVDNLEQQLAGRS
jgi:chromosomal replication initiator protein